MDPQRLQNLEWLDTSPLPLDWNGPRDRPFVEFRPEALDRPIVENLRRAAAGQGDRIAICDSHSSLCFGELWQGMCRLGQTVAAQTAPGGLVAVLLPACPASPLAMLACLAAGRPFVPIDVSQPRHWVIETLASVQPALIIGAAESCELAGVGAPAAPFVDVTRLRLTAPGSWRPADMGPDAPACVLLTSGSTGRAKTVVNCQRALQQRVAQSINGAHINADDRLLTLAPLASIVGVRDVLTALLAGASIHLLDAQRTPPHQILSIIDSGAITILFAVPALLRSIAREASSPASPALRLIRMGGETMLWSDVDLMRTRLAPDAAVQSIYAATEAPMTQWFVDESCRGESPHVPIGYPLPGNALAIIDELGGAAARGEVGELIVRSPFVALGPWSEVRAEGYPPASRGPAAQRVFRTGDLVRMRPDGLLERLGRKDRQVKIRGVRVELEGVEASVRRHPLVRDVSVLARTTGEGETTLVAYVSTRPDAPEALLDELRHSMSSSPRSMQPSLWYRVDEIPRLPNFKLDIRALQTLDAATVAEEKRRRELPSGTPDLRSDCIEPTVARIWQEVLQVPAAVAEQDFFRMGGDSLKAVKLTSELERAFGIELPISLINEAPSFGKLCAALGQCRTSRYVPLVLLKEGEAAPPVYLVHGLGGNIAELFAVARSMTYPGPVFGVQARGLRARETPHLTVEAMSAEYLRAIKARQPHGPYCLCGYSFGGLVAFEMARRLQQSGDAVAFVGLIDTMPSALARPLRAWPGLPRRRLARMLDIPVHKWPKGFWSAGERMLTRLRDHLAQRLPGSLPVPPLLKSAPASVLKVGISASLASARYRPAFYAGELTLFTATSRDPALPSPQVMWHRHALALSVVPTTGGHLTMLSAANAGEAAASLSRSLEMSVGSRSGDGPHEARSQIRNLRHEWTNCVKPEGVSSTTPASSSASTPALRSSGSAAGT